MNANAPWKRSVLLILALWLGVTACKDSESDDPPVDVVDSGSDAGSPDGGSPDAHVPDGGGEPTDGGGPTSDGVGFIDYTLPMQDAEQVPRNTRIHVAFVDALDDTTVGSASLTVTENGVAVAGAVTHDAATRSLAFVPARTFAADTLVTVTVATALRTTTGNSLPGPYVFRFSVGAETDTRAPTVSSTRPTHQQRYVAVGYPVYSLTFEEQMDPRTLNAETLRFEQKLDDSPAAPLTGAISYEPSSRTAYFRLNPLPAPGAVVTGTLSTQAKDLAGNALTSSFSYSFTLSIVADNGAPSLASTFPAYGATGVPVRIAAIEGIFAEPLRPTTVSVERFYLEEMDEIGAKPVRKVPGTVRYDDRRMAAIFTPTSPLAYQTRYRVTIDDVEDLAGNGYPWMGSNPFWFVTELQPAPPQVTGALPVGDARFVSRDGALRVSFDRPLDPASVNTTTFSVAGHSGLVNYEASTRTAVFRPVPPFAPATVYTATVKDVRTPQGQTLAAPFTYTLRTVDTRTQVSGATHGQPGGLVFATGPLGTLAVWNEDTGEGVQVRAALDSGGGYGASRLLGVSTSAAVVPQVAVWDNRFAISWPDATGINQRVVAFDGTTLTTAGPNTTGRLFSAAGRLFMVESNRIRALSGNQWAEVFATGTLGANPTFLHNGGAVLIASTPGANPRVAVTYDGVQWVQSSLSSRADADYLRVGDTFVRAWVSDRGTEFSRFDRATRQWSAPELISTSDSDAVKLATDGQGITAVYVHANGFPYAADRVGSTWQPEVRLAENSVSTLWGVARSHGNFVALWTASVSTSQLRATYQTGGSWSSPVTATVVTGMSRVRDLRVQGDDLLVLTETGSATANHQVWGTALTLQGWRPAVLLRDSTAGRASFIPIDSGQGVVFAAPGQLTVRAYQGAGEWAEPRPLAAPAATGTVGVSSIDFLPDGRGVAAWEQFDAGAWSVFLAEYDGTSWGQPVHVARPARKPRVARHEGRSVVAFQQPVTDGKLDVRVVSYEDDQLGTAVLLDSVTATQLHLDVDQSGGGFLVAWGIANVRTSYSADGLSWSAATTTLPADTINNWQIDRLDVDAVGSQLVVSARRYINFLARVSMGGIFQNTYGSSAHIDDEQYVVHGNTLMMVEGLSDEIGWRAFNGETWNHTFTRIPGQGGYALVGPSPQGLRLHTGKAWFRWDGANWVHVAASSRPANANAGRMVCDDKGCGAVAASPRDFAGVLALSYAVGTGPLHAGATPGETSTGVQYDSATLDFEAGTYRLTWHQLVEDRVTVLQASTRL
ncbi:Ig-like domain-containing protein [Myxococcus sp. AS-1-15]|uniref:Ig-like domain-containing protein n=1 Tax=Myxococcus sp. AS-1-15 TaxID=2874600 RepID=UPI001CBC0DBF|nr:Ig-like domain-containing protein [Myxococcus sp. AS-1-15]MBZ4394800.1 Ig-like domain-containing protein [Myxococcus sp. AS-1-15]